MIEFGAGGNITQAEDPVPAPSPATEGGADGTGPEEGAASPAAEEAPAAAPSAAPVTPATPRRKRKAKGWFCPVCRQRQ